MIQYIDDTKGRLRLISDKSFPVWSIVHYLSRFSITYLKLLTIERVCCSLAKGYGDDDLIVAEESAKLISTEPFIHDKSAQYKTLVNKGENYEEFWNVIKTHNRPIVFLRDGNNFNPLIDVRQDDLIINPLKVASPPDITVTGVGSTLTDLYYAGEREERNRQSHANRQIGQAARNIGDIASAQAMLSNPNLSSGIKRYLEALILALVEKQDELNREMGLVSVSVNVNVHT